MSQEMTEFASLISEVRDDNYLDEFVEDEYHGLIHEFRSVLASRLRGFGPRTDLPTF